MRYQHRQAQAIDVEVDGEERGDGGKTFKLIIRNVQPKGMWKISMPNTDDFHTSILSISR